MEQQQLQQEYQQKAPADEPTITIKTDPPTSPEFPEATIAAHFEALNITTYQSPSNATSWPAVKQVHLGKPEGKINKIHIMAPMEQDPTIPFREKIAIDPPPTGIQEILNNGVMQTDKHGNAIYFGYFTNDDTAPVTISHEEGATSAIHNKTGVELLHMYDGSYGTCSNLGVMVVLPANNIPHDYCRSISAIRNMGDGHYGWMTIMHGVQIKIFNNRKTTTTNRSSQPTHLFFTSNDFDFKVMEQIPYQPIIIIAAIFDPELHLNNDTVERMIKTNNSFHQSLCNPSVKAEQKAENKQAKPSTETTSTEQEEQKTQQQPTNTMVQQMRERYQLKEKQQAARDLQRDLYHNNTNQKGRGNYRGRRPRGRGRGNGTQRSYRPKVTSYQQPQATHTNNTGTASGWITAKLPQTNKPHKHRYYTFPTTKPYTYYDHNTQTIKMRTDQDHKQSKLTSPPYYSIFIYINIIFHTKLNTHTKTLISIRTCNDPKQKKSYSVHNYHHHYCHKILRCGCHSSDHHKGYSMRMYWDGPKIYLGQLISFLTEYTKIVELLLIDHHKARNIEEARDLLRQQLLITYENKRGKYQIRTHWRHKYHSTCRKVTIYAINNFMRKYKGLWRWKPLRCQKPQIPHPKPPAQHNPPGTQPTCITVPERKDISTIPTPQILHPIIMPDHKIPDLYEGHRGIGELEPKLQTRTIRQQYNLQIKQITLNQWEDHIQPTLAIHRKKARIRHMGLYLPKYDLNANQGILIITTTNFPKVNQIIKALYKTGKLKPHQQITRIGRKATINIQKSRQLSDEVKAIIEGCYTEQDILECEQRMIQTNNRNNYTWYKKRTGKQWIIHLEFPTIQDKQTYMKKWIEKNKQTPSKFRIYTHQKGQYKIKYQYHSLSGIKIVRDTITNIIHQAPIQDETYKKRILKTITSVLPPNIEDINLPNNTDMHKELDFLHVYHITKDMKESRQLTNDSYHTYDRINDLKIYFRNVGGALDTQLKEGSPMMLDIMIKNPHIIAIQEHMISKTTWKIFSQLYKILGYTLIAMRKSNKKHIQGRGSGGLALWVKDTLIPNYTTTNSCIGEYTQVTTLRPNNETDLYNSIAIYNTYLPPKHKTESVDQCIQRITSFTNNISQAYNNNTAQQKIIVGDLNGRNYESGDHKDTKYGQTLYEELKHHKLHVLNTTLRPATLTFTTGKKGEGSIVDLAITADPTNWTKMTITPMDHYRDTPKKTASHHSITIHSRIPVKNTITTGTYNYGINYNDSDKQLLHSCTHHLTTPAETNLNDATETALNLANTTLEKQQIAHVTQLTKWAIHHIIGLRVFGIKKNTSDVVKDIHYPDEIHNIIANYEQQNSMNHNKITKHKATQLRKKVLQYKKTRRQKQRKRARKTTVRKMFQRYKQKKNQMKIQTPKILSNGDEDRDIEQAYTHYITKDLMKTKPERKQIPKPHNPNNNLCQIFTENTTKRVFAKIQKDKAPGISMIPISYYYNAGKHLHKQMTRWYEMLIHHKVMPWILKLDIKTPLPKFGEKASDIDQRNPAKYRPIALQNSMYKILDGHIKEALEQHNKIHNHIAINQGGFKQKEGTIEHLFVLQNIFRHNTEVFASFLDLRKAYDTVPRDALIYKLIELYKIPNNLADTIELMYEDTWTLTRANHKLSPCGQTTRGLHQGALSSPILFNYFINDLITKLNKETQGTKLGNLTINNLFFADDILLTTTNKEHLQKLLNICGEWAKEWGLDFSDTKSQTITNTYTSLADITLQNKPLEEVTDKTYKYLGLPIGKQGVNVPKYIEKIKANFNGALYPMIAYCNTHQLTTQHRIIIYKSIIRSQLDYGIQVLHLLKKEIKDLENYQERALKLLLNIEHNTSYETLQAITNLPSIQDRYKQLKINFLMKIKQPNNRSLAHATFKQVKHEQVTDDIPRTAPIPEIEEIMRQHTIEQTLDEKCEMKQEDLKETIREIITDSQCKRLIQKINTAVNREKNPAVAMYAPEDKAGGPLMKHLDKYKHMQLKPDWSYVPNTGSDHKEDLLQILQQCDNNPHWYHPRICKHCHKKTTHHHLHKILGCNKYKENRIDILQSMSTEIQRMEREWHQKTGVGMDITDHDMHEIIFDGTIIQEGEVEQSNYHHILESMLGLQINPALPKYMQHKIKSMMTGHLLLLIQMTKNITPEDTTITTITHKQHKYHIFQQDLSSGKLIVRHYKEGQIRYLNIREILESFTIQQFTQYNIGLGSASNRTTSQKIAARLYADKLTEPLQGTIIATDGSIHKKSSKKNPKGGYGLAIIHKTPQQTHIMNEIYQHVRTNDPQITEIKGVLRAVDTLTNNIHNIQTNQIHILCDCINVVNYIKHLFQPPEHYTNDIYLIQQAMSEIQQTGKTIQIHWIPGHTGHPWNEIADELAKTAAADFPKKTQQETAKKNKQKPQHHNTQQTYPVHHTQPLLQQIPGNQPQLENCVSGMRVPKALNLPSYPQKDTG